MFLDNFYYNAEPPKNGNESVAPAPTHFIVRTTEGIPLLPTELSINSFSDELKLASITDEPNRYVGSTLIVEFLKIDNDKTEILYGVPVDVVNTLP
jgi:hypothetical protein